MSARTIKDSYSDIYLTSSGIALDGLRLVSASVFNNVPRFYFYKYALYKRFTEPKQRVAIENALVIHNHWSSGYHHWITESLVRLVGLDVENYNLIIPEDYPKFAFDGIATYGFKSVIKLPSKTGAFIKTAIIPANPDSGFYTTAALKNIQEHFFSYYGIPQVAPHARIYITRKNAAKRKIENEAELLPILEKYGFQVVDGDRLSFADQVKLFAACKYLISIHGAALTNCIFMGAQGGLIEFYKADTFINHCYERMCGALDINYKRLFCAGGKNAQTHPDLTDLVVDKNELIEILDTLK